MTKITSAFAAVLLVGLILTGSAAALTIGAAGRDAANYQTSVCNGYGGWSCVDGTYQWPACYNQGTNTSGVVQWKCYGRFEQETNSWLVSRYCDEYVGLGPYGGTPLQHSTYNCTT